MVLVEHVLDAARKRLVTLSRASLVCEAADILTNPDTPLAVVCDDAGIAVGVISRIDIVKLVGARVDPFSTSADVIMSTGILSCHVQQPLQQVWQTLNARSLRCAPVLDQDGRPQGVLHARDIASALLEEVTNEELLLRDYVLGIGYQ